MLPSQNCWALVRAFDLITPPAATKVEFRQQSQSFGDAVYPYLDIVASLLGIEEKPDSGLQGCRTPLRQSVQNRFDALLSVAYDVGIDVLLESPLPDVLGRRSPKAAVIDAFLSIPAFEDTLRDELTGQLALYRLPLIPRRRYEAELFYGSVFFTIGPALDADGNRVYAPSVLHPFYRFFYAAAGR